MKRHMHRNLPIDEPHRIITIYLSERMVRTVDRVVQNGDCPSRSEFLRGCIYRGLIPYLTEIEVLKSLEKGEKIEKSNGEILLNGKVLIPRALINPNSHLERCGK